MSWLADTVQTVHFAITMLALGLAACDHTIDFDTDRTAAEAGMDGAVVEAEAGEIDAGDIDGGLALGEGGIALCGNHICACSNGKDDDDEDTLADGLDSECTGAFDDDEASFRVNDVRGNKKCTDCFFDGNPGPGDDRCSISSHCSEDLTPANGGCRTCDANTEPACKERCLPITPNGCDCFGCCQVIHNGVAVPIRLVASCNMKELDSVEHCPRCLINPTCFNPCDACDLCPGKTLADLPKAPCMNDVDCDKESAPCKLAGDCNASEYCGQGCCVGILY